MKLFFISLFVFFGLQASADTQNNAEFSQDTGSTNLTSAYPSAPQLLGFKQITSIQVYNGTNQIVEVNCTAGSVKPATCASGLCKGSFHLAAGATLSSNDVSLGPTCWARANSASATSGTLYIVGFGW